MKSTFLRPGLAVLGCAAALALASPSMAAVVKMKAELKASNEVPPAKSNGTGMVEVTYDTATHMMSWNGTYSGLSGPAVAAHFHAGEMGKNGGVAVPIFSGTSAKSPFSGSKELTEAQAAQLMSGGWYVNIHTKANKAGEIRGQVQK